MWQGKERQQWWRQGCFNGWMELRSHPVSYPSRFVLQNWKNATALPHITNPAVSVVKSMNCSQSNHRWNRTLTAFFFFLYLIREPKFRSCPHHNLLEVQIALAMICTGDVKANFAWTAVDIHFESTEINNFFLQLDALTHVAISLTGEPSELLRHNFWQWNLCICLLYKRFWSATGLRWQLFCVGLL